MVVAAMVAAGMAAAAMVVVVMAVATVVAVMVAVMEEVAVGAVMAAAARVVAMVDAYTVSHSRRSRCRSRIGLPHRAGLSASPQPHPGKCCLMQRRTY